MGEPESDGHGETQLHKQVFHVLLVMSTLKSVQTCTTTTNHTPGLSHVTPHVIHMHYTCIIIMYTYVHIKYEGTLFIYMYIYCGTCTYIRTYNYTLKEVRKKREKLLIELFMTP